MKNRIKELRYIRAGDLIPHPGNWRQHPPGQRSALRTMFDDVGFASAPLVYDWEQEVRIIDGHLRVDEVDTDQEIPCLVLNVTEEEANKLLATIDVIPMLADPDFEALGALTDNLPPLGDVLDLHIADLLDLDDDWEAEVEKTDPSNDPLRVIIRVRTGAENEDDVRKLLQKRLTDCIESELISID